MSGTRVDRRSFLRAASATAAFTALPAPAIAQAKARIVIVGGGFGGAACARALARAGPRIAVTLVEANATYTAPPMSNAVIAGLRPLTQQQFGYRKIAAEGVAVVLSPATAIDAKARVVTVEDGTRLMYDKLVLAPGIDFRWNAIQGYDQAAAERIPHAWKDAAQIDLLRRQLDAMRDGGTVVMSVPVNPARCPPAPYERASLIAHFLKTRKPRAKLIVLDAKDAISMQRQFQHAWEELYKGLLEWVPLSSGGQLASVDVAAMTLATDFDKYKADVANIIPPQIAGHAAQLAGVADRTGWCPIDPVTFESHLQPHIHVIGDAAIAGAMPKSASAAASAAQQCATAVIAMLRGARSGQPTVTSTCYSLIAPDYAISLSGSYQPVKGQFLEIEGSNHASPANAPRTSRALEAQQANAWFDALTREAFA